MLTEFRIQIPLLSCSSEKPIWTTIRIASFSHCCLSQLQRSSVITFVIDTHMHSLQCVRANYSSFFSKARVHVAHKSERNDSFPHKRACTQMQAEMFSHLVLRSPPHSLSVFYTQLNLALQSLRVLMIKIFFSKCL